MNQRANLFSKVRILESGQIHLQEGWSLMCVAAGWSHSLKADSLINNNPAEQLLIRNLIAVVQLSMCTILTAHLQREGPAREIKMEKAGLLFPGKKSVGALHNFICLQSADKSNLLSYYFQIASHCWDCSCFMFAQITGFFNDTTWISRAV